MACRDESEETIMRKNEKRRALAAMFKSYIIVLSLLAAILPGGFASASEVGQVESGLGSAKLGNIFADGEAARITHSLTNKADKNINVTVKYRLYNSDGSLAEEYSPDNINLMPKEKKEIGFTLENMERFDIYNLECTLTEQCEGSAAETHIYNESVSRAMRPKKENKSFGACQQLSVSRGNAADAAVSMEAAGLSMLRDDVSWSEYDTEEKRAKNLPVLKERISVLKERGISYLALLWNTSKKPMSDGGNVPSTEKELEAWEKYCGMMAAELKGYTDYFEIWNEFNLDLFNTKNQPPEVYVEILKRSYRAIKEANPNAVIVAASPSEVDLEFLEDIFKLGALQYTDVIGVHPYDWTGQFREGRYVETMKAAQELMKKYGRVLPLWNTELGFGTCLADERYGHTREEQCAAIVRAYILNKSNKLAEKWIYYMFTDMDNPNDGEACFGLVNCWANKELKDWGAKESFLAVSALNSLIGEDSEVVGAYEDYNTREYAVNFYNSDMKKNVLTMESFNKTTQMTFYLGCSSVDILDMYGNKTETVSSENGVYTFDVGLKPIYAVGNFSGDISKFGYKSSIYSWQENITKDNFLTGIGKDGGSWGSNSGNEIEFDSAESAILLENGGKENAGEYEFFSIDMGNAISNGRLGLSFKFKSNGSYFGVIFDGADKEKSYVALGINPWGDWNDGPAGKKWTGKISTGSFPWGGNFLTESNELGQLSDDGFGSWLTVEISAMPKNKRYSLSIKKEDGSVIV